jgi:mannose-6-phosphate isomerase-like protein (cupin superfamily)
MPEPVNLATAFASFDEAWSPRIAGDVNDFQVKVVKLRGEFVWHAHEAEDELFLVVAGSMVMRLRDGDRTVRAGEFIVVPHGVEHCPFAAEEAHVLLFERAGTLNTGTAGGDRTVAEPERIR